MSKVDDYRETLDKIDDGDDYLRSKSGLPSLRGNLEIAHAVAELGNRERFEHFLTCNPQRAAIKSADEFLTFYGVEGLGMVVAALPFQGKQAMERWFSSTDKDISWIV